MSPNYLCQTVFTVRTRCCELIAGQFGQTAELGMRDAYQFLATVPEPVGQSTSPNDQHLF